MATNQIDFSPESLKKIARKAQLEKMLNELKVKQEKLKIRAEIENMDKSNEIKKLDKEIESLQKEQENYVTYEHPVLELLQKQVVLRDRLKKLEEKRTQIQPQVYDSLKNEYMGERDLINSQIESTLIQLRKIKQETLNGSNSLNYAIEELSIRKEIEEIPEDVYNERITSLKDELTQSEELNKAITFLLELVNK